MSSGSERLDAGEDPTGVEERAQEHGERCGCRDCEVELTPGEEDEIRRRIGEMTGDLLVGLTSKKSRK